MKKGKRNIKANFSKLPKERERERIAQRDGKKRPLDLSSLADPFLAIKVLR